MQVIPLYAEAGITGFESPAAQYLELGLSLDKLLIEHPNATFIGIANGDSMQGVGIYSGDLLLVDRAITAVHMDIIVANYNGSFVCKLLDKQRRQLCSAHPKYGPVAINEWDEFQIEGVISTSIRIHAGQRLTEVIQACMP
ncbi:translesion error-prone DNA polymerase V autoproteolytic subunit [Paraferrimonas sp. SM1919]|uniref:translesion error-prone DNA polymerase V autoproteolytic subunit n=1 Tax=Paraferrimonas sp. SM1919 TaxID=2662263 RepID=UPI0013D031C7|nr:translesion error-prone DNA polymerase V autoproteolytic subunit [Paraferrimonas sp. SM1919]